MERFHQQCCLTAQQSAERARLVATAQLRAKLGDKSASDIQTIGTGATEEARRFQTQLQRLRATAPDKRR